MPAAAMVKRERSLCAWSPWLKCLALAQAEVESLLEIFPRLHHSCYIADDMFHLTLLNESQETAGRLREWTTIRSHTSMTVPGFRSLVFIPQRKHGASLYLFRFLLRPISVEGSVAQARSRKEIFKADAPPSLHLLATIRESRIVQESCLPEWQSCQSRVVRR